LLGQAGDRPEDGRGSSFPGRGFALLKNVSCGVGHDDTCVSGVDLNSEKSSRGRVGAEQYAGTATTGSTIGARRQFDQCAVLDQVSDDCRHRRAR
jgi:hypothetical protein